MRLEDLSLYKGTQSGDHQQWYSLVASGDGVTPIGTGKVQHDTVRLSSIAVTPKGARSQTVGSHQRYAESDWRGRSMYNFMTATLASMQRLGSNGLVPQELPTAPSPSKRAGGS